MWILSKFPPLCELARGYMLPYYDTLLIVYPSELGPKAIRTHSMLG